MKRILWIFLLLGSLKASSQTVTYYDFYYTNLPVTRLAAFSNAFRTSFDRLYLPGYSDSCRHCSPIAANAQVKAEQLPGLRQELMQYVPTEVYQKYRVPGAYYHIVGTKTLPYIIRTLYTINGDKVEPQYQMKVTFTDEPVPQVYDIQVLSPKQGKHFSTKLVLNSYKHSMDGGR